MDIDKNNKRKKIYTILIMVFFIIAVASTSYAFFQFTKTGPSNSMTTSTLVFDFTDGSALTINNQFPIDVESIQNRAEISFNITAFNSLANGVEFNIYAIPGDTEVGLNRLSDSEMMMLFTPPANGDGFSITTNNFTTAARPVYNDGKCLIATGLVKDTMYSTTKTYHLSLWINDSKVFVSSTTKRAINAEGNPSLADPTSGNVSVGRYIKNNNNLVTTTLFPARDEQIGKTIYTTNEFKNSYYSIKIIIEAYDKK